MEQSKRIFIGCLGAALLMAAYTAAPGQDAKSASPATTTVSSPSLEETTSWLKDRITQIGGLNYGYTESFGNERTVLYRYTSTDFTSCRITVVLDTILDGRVSTTKSSSVLFQDLDGTPDVGHSDNPRIPGAAYAYGDRQDFWIKFHTTENKNLVRLQYLPSGMGTELPYLRLDFADGEMANRVAKAMSHAIEVCKAQSSEPF